MDISQPNHHSSRRNPWGGSAGAGGANFHARVAAVAAVHLLAKRPLTWLQNLERDIPSEILFETNGPGDDLQLQLLNGLKVEVQVKKGLTRGVKLWTALEALAHGIHEEKISYGVLIVDAQSSSTIRDALATGIARMGDGRTDDLDEISQDFNSRLTKANIACEEVCRRLRIVTVHCADHDNVTIQLAVGELRRICTKGVDASVVWNAFECLAHGLIERRGRWSHRHIEDFLRSVGSGIILTAPEMPLTNGFVWQHLGAVAHSRGLIQRFRQHYLYAGAPFGGREHEIDRLNRWLRDPSAPNRMLIHAPTARGKSALLVHWMEQLPNDATRAIVFVPISLRFGTDKPATYYSLLAAQLAHVLRKNLPMPEADQESHYLGICSDLMQQAADQGSHLLIVVDGLDESHGKAFEGSVFPKGLPVSIKILVSAREVAGDRDARDWLERLSWAKSGMALAESLAILHREAVTPILVSAGMPLPKIDDALVDRLMELTEGEPLLLFLYAEDIVDRKSGQVRLSELATRTPGFVAYFSRVFEQAADANQINVARDAVLAVLAMAMGPIQADHLTDLVCQFSGVPRPISKNEFVKPFKRFIAGDGSPDHGYVLNHPKLGEYLREDHFDLGNLDRVERAFLDWGRRVAGELKREPLASAPEYVLQRFVDHLSRAGSIQLDDLELLLTDGWRQAWFRLDNEYAGYADSLVAMSAATRPLSAYGVELPRAFQARLKMALCVSSAMSQGWNFPEDLLQVALQEELISLHQALEIARLRVLESRLAFMLMLAPYLPRTDLVNLLHEIRGTEQISTRMERLAKLAPHLDPTLRQEIAHEVWTWLVTACPTLERPPIAALLASALDDAGLERLVNDEMLLAADPTASNLPLRSPLPPGTSRFSDFFEGTKEKSALPDTAEPVLRLAPIIDSLLARGMNSHLERFITWCHSMIDRSCDTLLAVNAIAAMAKRVGTDKVLAHQARFAPLVKVMIQAHNSKPIETRDFDHYYQLTRLVEAAAVLELIEINVLPQDLYFSRLESMLQPMMMPTFDGMDTLQTLIPLIRIEFRPEFAHRAAEVAKCLLTANNRAYALGRLAKYLPLPERRIATQLALRDVRRIDDEYLRGDTLVALFAQLPSKEQTLQLQQLEQDIAQVPFILHRMDLIFRLSDQTPSDVAKRLTTTGLQLLQEAGSGDTEILQKIERFPKSVREKVFSNCIARLLLSRRGSRVKDLGFAAITAPSYWTHDHLLQAREIAKAASKFDRDFLLMSLIPIAIRLGESAVVHDALNEAMTADDPNQVLARFANHMDDLDPEDERRKVLFEKWLLAAKSERPDVEALAKVFKSFDEATQRQVWPMLLASSRLGEWAAKSLAMLSKLAQDPVEREQLLREAIDSCKKAKHNAKSIQATHIALAAEDKMIRWQALELMCENLQQERSAVLSSIKVVAPAIFAVGNSELVLDVMDAVRDTGVWWP